MGGEERVQVKSRKRVRDHGEVFTAEREVKAMCDLVKNETERIESTFLEPACGDGNFLAEILRRKLECVRRKYGRDADDYAYRSILVLMSLYGVDILADNVVACRKRLFEIWKGVYLAEARRRRARWKLSAENLEKVERVARFVLEKNILLGNTLSMKLVDADGKDLDAPIIFSDWKPSSGRMIKRSEYDLSVLMRRDEAHDMFDKGNYRELQGQNGNVLMPKVLKEYPFVDYRKLPPGDDAETEEGMPQMKGAQNEQ